MADFNRNPVGENGLARILEDLSLQRIEENDIIGSIAQIDGLQAALNGKAASSHTHYYAGSSTPGGAATFAKRWDNTKYINGLGVDGSIDVINYGVCNTAAATAAKVVNLVNGENDVPFVLKTGSAVAVRFTYTNTAANPTLNVNGTGAKAIHFNGGAILASRLAANKIYNFRYNGSAWDSITAVYAMSSGYVGQSLTIQFNGATKATYNGSKAKSVNITASGIGAAASSHTHNYAGSSSAGGAATSANKVNKSLKIQLNSGTTEGSNQYTFDGSTAKTVNITASGIGAAASSHTHKYAGSSSAGGAATSANKVNKSLKIQLNSGTTEGSNQYTFNGSADKTVNITASKIGAAAADHTHAIGDITNLQGEYVSKSGDQMFGPLLFEDTHYYNRGHFEGIGSGSFATSASSTSFYAEIGLSNFNQNTSLSLRFNGYNHDNPRVRIDFTVGILITYSSGTRKISTNGWYSEGMLTPSSVTARIIGSTLYIYYNFATLANYYTANEDNIFVRVDAIIHDAPEVGITGLSALVGTVSPPTSGLTTLTKLALASGTYVSWANITGKPSTFTPSSHTHKYAGSSSAGGAATSANKVNKSLKIQLNSGTTEGSNQFTFDGSTAKSVNITASGIGAAASSHTHKYAGSSSAGGAATSANKVNKSLKIQLNSGTTEGSNQYTFNGSADKTVNITAGKIGAALASNFGICYTAAATAAKVVSITGFSLVNGVEIAVKFTNDNTASHPTLNVSDTGAKNIIYNGGEFNYLQANRIYNFRFVQTSSTAGVGNWELVSSPYSYYAYSSTKATNATQWSTSRILNGLSVNGTRNLVNFGTCSTSGATAAKTITINGGSYFSLSTGAEVTVKFTNTNTVSGLTLNVNGTGAKAIYYRGKNIPYHVILANKLYTFRYDGSYWQLVGNASSLNKTYLTNSNLGTSSGSPGPDNIDDLIIDNELNYLDIYVSSAATAARYYLKIPDKEVGTIIDIGIRKNVNNKKLQAVQLAREGTTGPTIYLPDGSGGYPNVDIAVGAFVRLYRADENGWIMYRYATV